MASIRKGTAALLIAGFALSAAPAFADQHDRHGRDRSRNNTTTTADTVVGSPFVPLRATLSRVRPASRVSVRLAAVRLSSGLEFELLLRPAACRLRCGTGGYYPPANYGYYAISPGVPYGSVRIVDAPRDAQVLVDGYYAGVVDDYDGVFQHLNLEPGAHRIEIQSDGFEPIGFDVRVVPGQTITYRANAY